MGCTASKLDNEDTVRRCKERRRFMKEAVYARHHMASAHADYCRSLRLTGSALCDFAVGEQLSVSDQTPAVFIHPPNPSPPPPPPPSSTKTTANHVPPPPVKTSPSPSPSPSLHQPPPPPFSPSPHMISAPPKGHRKPPPKLPHILSESSLASTPRSQMSNHFFPTAYPVNSTYSSTPSQTSSVWNWENFRPPSPPDSEFFNRKTQEQFQTEQNHHLDADRESGSETEMETERSEYDFFQPQANNRYNLKEKENPFSDEYNNHMNSSVVDEETEREEVQCSEWGDHYSTTTSSDEEEGDKESRSEMGARSDFGSSVQQQPIYSKKSEDGVSSSASYRTREISDMKLVVRHKDLKEIVEALKENFEKAAAAGDQLSEILEISRAQLDRSFKQLKSKFYKNYYFTNFIC